MVSRVPQSAARTPAQSTQKFSLSLGKMRTGRLLNQLGERGSAEGKEGGGGMEEGERGSERGGEWGGEGRREMEEEEREEEEGEDQERGLREVEIITYQRSTCCHGSVTYIPVEMAFTGKQKRADIALIQLQ